MNEKPVLNYHSCAMIHAVKIEAAIALQDRPVLKLAQPFSTKTISLAPLIPCPNAAKA